MGQQTLADMLGKSKQLVSHWEKGRCQIQAQEIIRVAALLGIDGNFLLTGQRAAGQSSSPLNLKLHMGVDVAMPNNKQIIGIAKKELTASEVGKRRVSFGTLSYDAISFDMFDDSNEPTFPEGSIAAVDPRHAPNPGDMVLVALLKSSDLVFGRYRTSGKSNEFVAPCRIAFENPNWEARAINREDKPVYMGKLREHTVLYDM